MLVRLLREDAFTGTIFTVVHTGTNCPAPAVVLPEFVEVTQIVVNPGAKPFVTRLPEYLPAAPQFSVKN